MYKSEHIMHGSRHESLVLMMASTSATDLRPVKRQGGAVVSNQS